MAKKIRWTLDLLRTVDISKLSNTELARAYSFASHRINNEIKKMKKFEEETGYRSPSLDFVEIPGSKNKIKGKGIFTIENPYKSSQKQLRTELSRMKYFLNLESSSMPKVRKLINKQKEEIISVTSRLGMHITKKSISLKDMSDFYHIFRLSLEDKEFSSYGSDQLKEAVWEVYQDYGNMDFSSLVNYIKDSYKRIYEKKQLEREEALKGLEEAEKIFNKPGRKKNSSSMFEGMDWL